MSCQTTQELIHAYVDGELDLARSLEVEQHMQECQACASAYRNQTALRSAFKDSSLYHSAPPKLEKRIRSSLRREAKSEVGRRSFGWRWLPVGVGLALVLLMALVIWRAVPGLRPSGDELLAQEIVSNHVRGPEGEGKTLDDGTKVPSLREGEFKFKTEDEIYKQISGGGNGMTPFRDLLTDRELKLMTSLVHDDLRSNNK